MHIVKLSISVIIQYVLQCVMTPALSNRCIAISHVYCVCMLVWGSVIYVVHVGMVWVNGVTEVGYLFSIL